MSLTFTRKFLDSDGKYIDYKNFAIFNDELVTYDLGTAANDARILSSADGSTWGTLVSIPSTTAGNANAYDGNAITVYKKNLFLTLYRSPGDPKIIEYSRVDGSITTHLTNPQAGGQDNHMGADAIVWNRHLWVVTDATAFVNDRRIVYYYDGSSWTAITDYDGSSYLDYNHSDTGAPILDLRNRTTRLFVFNGELYLIATRYDSSWGWEVWKFDAETYDNFTLIYDSSALDDNFALMNIVELDQKIWLIAEILTYNGNPSGIGKLYSSEDMESWTEESTFDLFTDEFDDASRDDEWTDDANNGSITESGDTLTLAVANGVNGNFDGATENAPLTTIEVSDDDEIVIETKLNSYTVNDDTRAGIYVTDTVSGNNGIIFGRYRNDSFSRNGLQVRDVGPGGGQLAYQAVTTLPIWLNIRISGTGAGSVMKFDYSTDGLSWYNLYTLNNESWTLAGLIAMNWGVHNAISAPFEFFHVHSLLGNADGATVFEGRIYVNAWDPVDTETKVKYYSWLKERFILEQSLG